jgi:hypothetical protein
MGCRRRVGRVRNFRYSGPAKWTVGGAVKAGGDHRDDNAINQSDRKLNCVGCHTPIRKKGQLPTDVGAGHLTNVWAPIFSDLLLHHMPVIDAERDASMPRDVVVISRLAMKEDDPDDDPGKCRIFDTLDLPRNLADDAFTNFKVAAGGSEFRTAPLMELGRTGPPLLHDARVYLSKEPSLAAAQQQLQIDHDAAHRTRLASEDMAVLFIVGGEGGGAILLDRTFEKRDFASTALTGAA